MKKVILILVVFLLTGCYDYVELDDMGIVSSMFIEREDDEFVVSLEILNTNEDIPRGSEIINARGKTFMDAITSLQNSSDNIPYYSHMNMMVISEDVAKEGIEFLYDFYSRNISIRKDFYIYVAEDVQEFIDFKTDPGQSIGENIKKMTEKSMERNGTFATCEFREVIYDYLRDMDFVLGSIKVDDDKLKLDDKYAFVDNKMSINVQDEVALVINMLKNSNKSFAEAGRNSYEIHEYSLSPEIKKDAITFKLKGAARMSDIHDKAITQDQIEDLTKELNKGLENMIMDVVLYTKEMDMDLLGLNHLYYLHYPKEVKSDSWKNLKYSVKADVTISEKGMIMDSLGGIKNEG